jgi:hypothetical protein
MTGGCGAEPGDTQAVRRPADSVPTWDGTSLTIFPAGRNRKRRVNVIAMTRRLVLTNEAARHPLRRTLPPPPKPVRAKNGDQDVKLFLLSFAAFFTCFYTFLF